MSQELEDLTRGARPEDLASLRRLEEELHRTGWRVEGRTIREWVADFSLPPSQFPQDSEPVAVVGRAGLAAVPVLVDTLRAKQLAPRLKKDLRIRGRCLEALGLIQPPPVCVIPVVLKTLRVRSPRVQRQALALLARLRPAPDDALIQALLVCLTARNEPLTRLYAVNVLTQLSGPLPAVLLRAALERLGDPDRRVRRYILRVFAQLPEPDSEVLTALEEQVLLDDENRIAVLRLLARLAPARAFPLLVEEIRRLETLKEENTPRFEQALKALRIVGVLGARAESLIPTLCQLRGGDAVRVHVEAVVDSIVRDSLYQSRPGVSPSQVAGNALATRLVQEVPPPPDDSGRWSWALAQWADGFLPLGQELCVRMALAAARRVAGNWDDTYPYNEYPRSGLLALEDWVCEPTEQNAQQAVYRGNNVPSQFSAPEAFSASWAITYATQCVSSEPPPEDWNPEGPPRCVPGGHLGACLRAACNSLAGMSVITWSFGYSEDAPEPLTPEQAARELHRAILDEVLPWLCGTWDPVKEPHRLRREWLGKR